MENFVLPRLPVCWTREPYYPENADDLTVRLKKEMVVYSSAADGSLKERNMELLAVCLISSCQYMDYSD